MGIINGIREVEDDSDVLIECKDVHKSFGEKQILRGVSFKVNDFMLANENAGFEKCMLQIFLSSFHTHLLNEETIMFLYVDVRCYSYWFCG